MFYTALNMENVGEALTASAPIPVQGSTFEPELSSEVDIVGESITDSTFEDDELEGAFDLQQDYEDESSNVLEEFDLEDDDQIESEPYESEIEDGDETFDEEVMLDSVRQEVLHEVEKSEFQAQYPGFSPEQVEIMMALLAIMLAKIEEEKRRNRESFIEIIFKAFGMLMREMFVPEENEKKIKDKKEKSSGLDINFSINSDDISKIRKALFNRKKSLTPSIENAAA